jgi:hypothetical protein
MSNYRKLGEPIIAILKVAEAIAVGLSFTRALGWKEDNTKLQFAFLWNKLAGRRLATWAHPGAYLSTHAMRRPARML